MTISFDISQNLEVTLREALGPDLGKAALEALLLEGYRRGRLSSGDIAVAMQLDTRCEAEQWLAQRGVLLNYSLADLKADRDTLDQLLGSIRR